MVNAIPWPRRIIYLPPILSDMYRRVHAHRHCCIFPFGGNAIVNGCKIGHAVWLSTIGLMKEKGNGESPGEAFSQKPIRELLMEVDPRGGPHRRLIPRRAWKPGGGKIRTSTCISCS